MFGVWMTMQMLNIGKITLPYYPTKYFNIVVAFTASVSRKWLWTAFTTTKYAFEFISTVE